MRKLILIITLFIILISSVSVAGRCFKPFKPFLPPKPYWCHGVWTQVLVCDTYCNCEWQPVCLEN